MKLKKILMVIKEGERKNYDNINAKQAVITLEF